MNAQSTFYPHDSDRKQAWDITAPLFNDFFIIGPDKIDKTAQPSTIYHFPNKKSEKNYERFLFPDGVYVDDVKYKTTRQVRNEFSSINKIEDNLIYFTVEGNTPVFVYAMVFKASPISMPALLMPLYIDMLQRYRDERNAIPVFKYAFVFSTSHPFHDLFFGLLNSLLNLEFQTRNTKNNLKMLKDDFRIPNEWDPKD